MFAAFEYFMLCNPTTQKPSYIVTLKHQSLFQTKAGVQTADLLGLYMPANCAAIFLS
jgi:hypothetical protein